MGSLNNSMSHKREKRRNYTMEFKCAAIEYAEKNSNHKAGEKLGAVERIREWRQSNLKIFERVTKPKNKNLEAGRRKPLKKPISLMNL